MVRDAAAVITAVGVILAVLGIRQAQIQRVRDFESFYVRRYWKIMDRLSLDALKGVRQAEVDDEDERAVRAYLWLCEDELELRKDGWIGRGTWMLWAEGMRAQIDKWPFNHVWDEVCDPKAPPTGQAFELLRSFLDTPLDSRGRCVDPIQIKPAHAWLRGVAGGPFA